MTRLLLCILTSGRHRRLPVVHRFRDDSTGAVGGGGGACGAGAANCGGSVGGSWWGRRVPGIPVRRRGSVRRRAAEGRRLVVHRASPGRGDGESAARRRRPGGGGGRSTGTGGGCGSMCNRRAGESPRCGRDVWCRHVNGRRRYAVARAAPGLCGGSQGDAGAGRRSRGTIGALGLRRGLLPPRAAQFVVGLLRRGRVRERIRTAAPMHICRLRRAATGACTPQLLPVRRACALTERGIAAPACIARRAATTAWGGGPVASRRTCATRPDERNDIDDSDCNSGQSGSPLPYCAYDGTVMHWRCTSMQVADCPS